MSVAITKQTITGSELPTGGLISYVKDRSTGAYTILTSTSGGGISIQGVIPFPPTEFTSAPVSVGTAKYNNGSGLITSFTSISKVEFLKDQFGHYSGLIVGTASGLTGTAVFSNIVTYNINENYFYDSFYVNSRISPTLLICETYGTTVDRRIYGLGKDSVTSQPNLSIKNGVWTANVNVAYVKTSSNSCLNYGYSIIGGTLYVLLNDSTGALAKIDNIDTSNQVISPTYSYLTIPSGGVIKQLSKGYYLCTNAADDLFLYSINNGGEFVCQLDRDTYDEDTAIEFFDVI